MPDRALLGALAALVTLAAACGGDDGPTAPAPDPLVGEYRLATINGRPLPFTLRPDSTRDPGTGDTIVFTETIVRDDYTLGANGRFSNSFKFRSVETTTEAGVPADRDSLDATILGRWARATVDGQAKVRLVVDSFVDVSGRYALPAPDTFHIPLPTASGWTLSGAIPHESLGPDNPLLVPYTLLYVKQ